MASTSQPTVEDAKHDVLEHGFSISQDPSVGNNVQHVEESGIALASDGGLRFIKDNVIDHSVSQNNPATLTCGD